MRIACTEMLNNGRPCPFEAMGRDEDGRMRCSRHSQHGGLAKWMAKTPAEKRARKAQNKKWQSGAGDPVLEQRRKDRAEEYARRQERARQEAEEMIPIVPLGKLMPSRKRP